MISWAPEQINCGENQMWAKIEAETLSFFFSLFEHFLGEKILRIP